MMGSKSTTYYNVSATTLFKPDDNLFSKQMIRYYALTKNIEPLSMGKFLIQNIGFFFNNKLFEKMGVAVKGTITQSKTNTSTIMNTAIAQSLIPAGSNFINYYSVDDNNDPIDGSLYIVKQWLEENYVGDNSYEKQLSKTYAISNRVVFQQTRFLSLTVTKTYNKYKVNPNNQDYYLFDSFTQNQDGSYHIKLINETDNTDIYYEDTPIDNRLFYIIAYNLNSNIGATLETTSSFLRENTTSDALLFGIKKNGNNIGDTKYKNALKLKFGLGAKGNDSFEENIINNSQIKNTFLSYTAKSNDSNYSNEIKSIYGEPSDLNIVTYTGSDFIVEYGYEKYSYPLGEGEVSYNLDMYSNINGTQLEKNKWTDEQIYVILPIDTLIENKTLSEKYNILRDLLTLVAESEVVVKHKWYETGFFSFIVTILSAAFAIATGNIELFAIMYTGSTIINMLVKNPMLKVVLNVVIFAIAGVKGYIKLDEMTKIDWAMFDFQTTTSLFKAKLSIESKKIYSNIKSMNAQNEKAQDMINKIKKKAMYMPFDLQNFYYNTMYELPYQQFAYIEQSTQINTDMYNPFN